MSRFRMSELPAALRALFAGNQNINVPFPTLPANTQNALANGVEWAYGNTAEMRWKNAAGSDDVRALSVNASDQVMVAESLATGMLKTVSWEVLDNASIATQGFFLVNPGERYRVKSISWIHTTQSSVAGTAKVEKTPSGIAPGSGTSLMSGTFDLHAIVNNTLTTATLTTTNSNDSDNPDLILNPGDMLTVVIAGTITSLAGVQCTVVLAPLGKSVKTVTFYMNANADLVQNQPFFVGNRSYVVSAVSMRWSTKSSVSGLKLTVTNDTTGTAPGGGTSVLTDNTNAGPLVTQAANTTYAGTVSTTAATVRVLNTSFLSAAFSGATLTALAGVVVTVSLLETAADRTEKTFFMDHVVGQTTLVGIAGLTYWTADRDYEVLNVGEVHRVLGTDVGAVTLNVGIASDTTAPASGTVGVITALSIKTTNATPQFATLGTIDKRIILAGQRLCIIPSGTFTAAAGVAITVSLAPR